MRFTFIAMYVYGRVCVCVSVASCEAEYQNIILPKIGAPHEANAFQCIFLYEIKFSTDKQHLQRHTHSSHCKVCEIISVLRELTHGFYFRPLHLVALMSTAKNVDSAFAAANKENLNRTYFWNCVENLPGIHPQFCISSNYEANKMRIFRAFFPPVYHFHRHCNLIELFSIQSDRFAMRKFKSIYKCVGPKSVNSNRFFSASMNHKFKCE